jgi:two-component system response regulator AlgR
MTAAPGLPPMKVLIVDDEPLARQRLRDLLTELGEGRVVGEAGNGRDAIAQAQESGADVVLLDIAMPVMDGLEAARHLAALEHPPAVVFCTAYEDHALAAFEAAAVDYLLKPVRPQRLHEALARARRIAAAEVRALAPTARARTHLAARLRGALRLIPLHEVRYLQAEEKYVVVHHAHGEDLIEDSLKSLEEEFAARFVRIHRSCLVACDEVARVERNADGNTQVVLRGGASLEVSRRCTAALRERLKHV